MLWAHQGREYAEMDRLAFLVANILNCHVDTKKQRPYRAWDIWHRPGTKRPSGGRLTVDALHGLKSAFTNRV